MKSRTKLAHPIPPRIVVLIPFLKTDLGLKCVFFLKTTINPSNDALPIKMYKYFKNVQGSNKILTTFHLKSFILL